MLHRSRVNLHSPCSGAVGVPTRRRSTPPPIAGAAPERYAGGPVGAPTPDSNRQCAAPTPPASQHRPHQPKCAPNGGSGPGVVAAPALPHPGLGYRRGAPSQPAADPGYPPRYVVCGPSLSCQRRNPAAPFFGGFHRLAVNNRPTRNSDGNPDSPQVVVFLATIVDVTVGS